MSDKHDNTADNPSEDLSGLKNKVSELHRLLKAATDRADKAERDRDDAAETAINASATDLEKAIKRAEKAERDSKAAQDDAAAKNKSLRDYKAETALSKALLANNVDAKHIPLLNRAFKADTEFTDDGEPMLHGMSINDYTKSYFAKEGLSYVRAADNSGGGAQGSDGSKASTMTKDTVNYSELAKMYLDSPAQADVVARSVGVRPLL